ncbi:MAG: signal peptidase I, partial [Desulfovibrio sp.]|nr:signal peptidase I [Desulfovibrio sp.]
MKEEVISPRQKEKPLWREYAEALVVALGLALIIRTFCFQAFKIPSESMLDTLLVGDHLIGTKFDYGLKLPFTDISLYKGDAPQRGDIVIF